jgi:hypothetical protein
MINANSLGKVNDCTEAERKTKKIGHRCGLLFANRGGARVCPSAGSAEGVPQ